uniref:Uncharacterized protein n=1 Tax=Anguilla anguilla TaxID=7936 RepID=A0A0E9PQV3_ANGAN
MCVIAYIRLNSSSAYYTRIIISESEPVFCFIINNYFVQ